MSETHRTSSCSREAVITVALNAAKPFISQISGCLLKSTWRNFTLMHEIHYGASIKFVCKLKEWETADAQSLF